MRLASRAALASAESGTNPDGLASLIARLIGELDELWPDRPGHSEQVRELGARLAEERLQIAVLGQFKRGKSTLLNALLGQKVLPYGVVPLTAIPTFIRWGPAASLRISYLDNRPPTQMLAGETATVCAELHRLVTEEGNPHNREKVARVDVNLPAPILGHGVVLIDTPGIGSTYQHNTDAALRVLPECDAALFVLSADPPVTAVELEYLDRVRPHVARLFFILNKIDYLDEAEREVAADFLRRTLREHMPGDADIELFSLSARQALDAKQAGDAARLAASGLARVEDFLAQFLAREKTAALRHAIAAKAAASLGAARMDIALAVRALEMPIEDLETRAGQFGEALREVGRQRRAVQDLVAGDRRRALADLEARVETLRGNARAALLAVCEPAFERIADPEAAENAAKALLAEAIPGFFGARLDEVSHAFARDVEESLAQHVGAAQALIDSVRQKAASLFDIPALPVGGADVFVLAREPFWVTQKWDQTIGALAGGALQKLIPRGPRAARARKRLASEIEELVQRNVENLRWATVQNLENAFRRFSGWFEARLTEAIAATQGAIDAALRQRRSHEEQAQHELSRLRRAAERLAAVQRDLTHLQKRDSSISSTR
ncbi:MAG TPA: dynamin family protein [Stellaceae bacterium]|nr:dynamin family protein [Stellaceae bacterium]